MTITLTSTADILSVVFAGPKSTTFTARVFLGKGSWTTTVLKHPEVFTHSPQKLTSAKTESGPGCQLKYTADGSTGVLGFIGTASNVSAVDMELPDDDPGLSDVDQ